MYPRNAASPERISIGPVVLIADGTVQTSGVTVRILPFGGSEADGAGTTAYSTDGVVLYTPTQAETNYTSFVLIAKKSACIPANVTVVTSARSVSGEVQVGGYATGQVPLQPTTAGRTLDVSVGGEAGIDLANIGSPTTTVNLSGVTIKTATDIETDTQDIQSRIPAALVDGRIVANAQVVGDKTGYTATVSDKTGFKLASDGLALVTAWTVGITGNLTGNVTGSVGSISGVSFPANFSLLGIGGTGAILLVDTVDELGASALTANGAVDAIPTAVWNALTTTTYTDQSFGDRLLISTNNNREVAVTGSHHVAAVLHDAEPDSIPEDAFQNGALSARVIADNAIDAASIAANALNGKGDWLTTLGATAPAGWINAAAFTTDAITNDKIAASAVTKITVNLFKYGDIQRWNSPANQIDVTITKV